MVLYWVFLLFCSCVLSASEPKPKHDFRFISYQDLQLSAKKFSESGIIHYSQILFDVSTSQILVGARDMLYRLSIPNLNLLEKVNWPSSKTNVTQCINKGQSEDNCHNFVKILLTNGKKIFACGTNSFSPICTWRKMENLSEVTHLVDGIAKCPYNPSANITGLMLENSDYFFGGPTDFSGSDFLLAKSRDKEVTIRTKQYNSLWLNEPQFVGSFETDKFVYFLFREAAVEYINCGKAVYSRIARVCKNDEGGHKMFRDNWSTFIKARLNCSISGDYPFYFDEIQSMSYVPNENILYATFTTPINSISGSAICAFNLTAINDAFNGPFKYQNHIGSAWGKQDVIHRDHFECRSSPSSHLLETSNYQLMDTAVQATTLNPLHVAQLERFTHITIDVLPTKLHKSVHIIYAATLEGLIKKISVLPRTQETCIVEIWQTTADANIPINNMQFLKETNSVYITTKASVMKIPSDHCKKHTSLESCINSMDPYCGWNELEELCMTAPNDNPLDKYWAQSVTSCPILDTRVDGGWSSWSKWSPCIHRTSVEGSGDQCLCQERKCDNPAPTNGGRPCEGFSMAVTNCTMHGGWSDWSAWSACSATCGIAVKTRSRTCTNPAPAHGGRVCVGQDRAEAFCTELQPCPTLPQDGGWGEWESWSICSVTCGMGFIKRQRKCDSPPPLNGGQYCIGNDVEYSKCFDRDCDEHKKYEKLEYTDWFEDGNRTSHDTYRKRFRFACKVQVKQPGHIKTSLKKEVQICPSRDRCFPSEKIDQKAKWGQWSLWGECSVVCGGGYQNRTRQCEGSGCQGTPVQTRECNNYPCQDQWGCWTDWSPCNVSCGWGVKVRHRACLGENCQGIDKQSQPCEEKPCDSLLGWSNWTAWSVCDKNNEQHRKRQCRSLNPGAGMCQGPRIETRMCITETFNDINPMGIQLASSGSAGMVVAYILLGSIFGVASGMTFMHCYLKKKKPSIPSSPHYMSAKQNPYIAVPLQERPKKCSASSSNILNNVHNGTLKSKCYEYDTTTMKRNSHGLNNGHTKQDLIDDKYYYD